VCRNTAAYHAEQLIRHQRRARAARNGGYEGPGATTTEVEQYAIHGGFNAARFADVLTGYAPWFTKPLGVQ
jgi:hypothetical protein